MKHSSEIAYRADIDGLRALAVLSVIAFHAFPSYLPGGFIGVDIFFVISGYLISSIIFKSFRNESFSLGDFYSRRILRIFPALFLVLSATLIFGWFYFFAAEYAQLGKHIAAGAGFVSNLVLWRESGYFDAAAEVKPLLHLWSLGVEEQFYLVWPLLIWLFLKMRGGVVFGLGSVFLVSFASSLYLTYSDSAAAYYSPVSRFWELTAGGLLAYFILTNGNRLYEMNKKWLDVYSLAGTGLLLIGLFIINKKTAFPGYWALLPVTGAVLLLLSGPTAIVNKWILSNKWAVWVGLISYPLYLWHWPLLVIPRIVGVPLYRETKIILVIAAVVLAWLTYRLIEKPIRNSKARKRNVIFMTLAVSVSGVFGFLIYSNNGMPNSEIRRSEASKFVKIFENTLPKWKYDEKNGIAQKVREECNFYDIESHKFGFSTRIPRNNLDTSCYVRDSSILNSLLVWGDSHAQRLNYGLKNNLPANWQVLQVASSACPASVHVSGDPALDYCVKSNMFALEVIKVSKPDVVIVAQNLEHNTASIISIDESLKKLGVKKVIFLGPTPHWKIDLPLNIARNLWPDPPVRTKDALDFQVMDANELLKRNLKRYSYIDYVDVIEVFCDKAGCMTRVGDNPVDGITSADNSHLTPIASDYLAKKVLVERIVKDSEMLMPSSNVSSEPKDVQ